MGASEVVAVFNAPEHADIVTKPSNQGVGVEFLVNSRVITCVVKELPVKMGVPPEGTPYQRMVPEPEAVSVTLPVPQRVADVVVGSAAPFTATTLTANAEEVAVPHGPVTVTE